MKIKKLLEKESVELVGAKRGEAHRAWPNVTYHGNDLFQTYIHGAQRLKNHVDVDQAQEIYLGYSPKEDTFYSGWDTWPSDEGLESTVVAFKIDKDGQIGEIYHVQNYDRGFYGYRGGGQNLSDDIPDLQDVRVD